jgi:hypothetical protein
MQRILYTESIYRLLGVHIDGWLCSYKRHYHIVERATVKGTNILLPRKGAVNTPLQQYSYCWKRCFLHGSCRGVVLKTVGATQLVVSCRLRVEFCTGACEDRT